MLNGGLTCSSCKYSRTPNAPELVSYQSGITLKAYEGLEYSQDGINWQNSNVFPNSQSKTFYQRVKASTIAQESSVSPAMVLCTISFDGNGGSDAPENICFVLGTEVSLPTAIPTKSGFVFDGWNTTEYTTSFDPGETVSFSDDIVLYAMWDVPGSGIKLASPALANRFFTTEPPGKPSTKILSCAIKHQMPR